MPQLIETSQSTPAAYSTTEPTSVSTVSLSYVHQLAFVLALTLDPDLCTENILELKSIKFQGEKLCPAL